ncbi:AIPR family protein [Ancylobacter sp.]|uniref:AIPR family protein n=1 Tax=Ancylobacter sp. TaxID=1872567 RepID=UPI003C7B5624
MRPAALPDSQRENFANLLLEEMAREQEEEGVSPDEAFLRVALKTHGFDPDEGHQTDGGYDCGFDFVNVTQEETSIFQAKSLGYGSKLPIDAKFDASYLNDLRRIIDVIRDLDHIPREANSGVTDALTSMRTEINRRALAPAAQIAIDGDGPDVLDQQPEYRINIYFFGLGRGFTSQAEEEFTKIESVRPIRYGRVLLTISVHHVFIDDLLSIKWQQRNVDWRDKLGRKRDEIQLNIVGDAILVGKSAVFFAPAYDLVQAYEDFGYQIFEPNVRCELKESKVNQAIKSTVQTREGRREFQHLNNGITLICTGWGKKQNAGRVSALQIRKPGVVNGLQTVKSLHDAFRRLSQDEQIDFKENCLVLCRVHQEGAVKRPEQLVKATNNQNPMKARNLRSNDPEQIAFERLFSNINWFYERKQGAWDAFKADHRAWRGLNGKRPEHFHVSGKLYRVVDNDQVAQNWLAFIGFSTEAINEKKTIFDKDEYYSLIFLKRTIRHGFDYDFKLTMDSKVWNETEAGSPRPEAMLVAYLCREAADHLALGRRENRDLSIARLSLETRSRDEQDRALDTDPEYQKQKILRGMLTLFSEFVGFVMFRSLDKKFHENVGKLLNIGTLKSVTGAYDFTSLTSKHRNRTFDKNDIIIILYLAFEHCISQLYESNWLRGYNDAPVKNKYIYSTRTRRQLLEELIELDKRFSRTEWVRDWADGFNESKGVFAFVREVVLEQTRRAGR